MVQLLVRVRRRWRSYFERIGTRRCAAQIFPETMCSGAVGSRAAVACRVRLLIATEAREGRVNRRGKAQVRCGIGGLSPPPQRSPGAASG